MSHQKQHVGLVRPWRRASICPSAVASRLRQVVSSPPPHGNEGPRGPVSRMWGHRLPFSPVDLRRASQAPAPPWREGQQRRAARRGCRGPASCPGRRRRCTSLSQTALNRCAWLSADPSPPGPGRLFSLPKTSDQLQGPVLFPTRLEASPPGGQAVSLLPAGPPSARYYYTIAN